MDYMVIFDIVILALGVYELYATWKMRREQKISTLYVAPQEIEKCLNPEAFIAFLSKRAMIFGLITAAFGIEGLVDDLLYDLGTWVKVVALVIFIGTWGWFSFELRKGKNKYFK